jgi:hypothetical protein
VPGLVEHRPRMRGPRVRVPIAHATR